MTIAAVILAAGQGTRMKSRLPKMLHPLGGRPLIQHAVELAWEAIGSRPVVVVGQGAEAVRQRVADRAEFVVQSPPLGTAHAVAQAQALLAGKCSHVLAYYGDMPLLRASTLRRLVEHQHASASPLTLLSGLAPASDSRGFGRVLRDSHGKVMAIVEEAQATPEQLAIRELNAGAYCFDADWLWQELPRLPLSPKGEYYLTDLVATAAAAGQGVEAVLVDDPDETIGVNTRADLADAETALRRRINRAWMLAGVTLVDPATTYIEPGVRLGMDTVILPNTHLLGATAIGEGCRIGPDTVVRDTVIGQRCEIECSVLEGAVVEDEVEIGPFAHLRRGAHLARGVHMGNFGEVKNSYLGPGVKMGHFSYVGDATIGAEVNLGAGTITCNFDGVHKYHTEIGEGAFIGSDTMLVAPLKVGAGARTGAGSVVTKDVPEKSLAVGVPARVIRRLD